MSFTLEKVVPWGRTFDEYVAMFSLSAGDLQRRILGCGDGPAAFNAALTQMGGHVISVDPLYQFAVEDIRVRIRDTFEDVIEQTRNNRDEFIWTSIRTVDELGQVRIAAMEAFLADYPQGLAQGRYVTVPCRICHTGKGNSSWRYVHTCFFYTVNSFRRHSMWRPSGKCAALLVKCEFFHCLSWAQNLPGISKGLPTASAQRDTRCVSGRLPMNFKEAGIN